MLGNVNRVGADGSRLDYDQTGNYKFRDPYTGKSYNLPTFTARESLSPEAQAIFDANQGAELNLAETARDQSGFMQDYLGEPWKPDTSEIESRIYDLGSRTLDTTFGRQRGDLQTQLSNQGIKLGSSAYDRAMSEQAGAENDAYGQLALRGRGQAFGELQAQRNQPINEISALMSGSQVAMPGYGINQPSPVPTTDNAGLINSNYNQRMSAWQQREAQKGAMLGGLFQLGGTLGSAGIMMGR